MHLYSYVTAKRRGRRRLLQGSTRGLQQDVKWVACFWYGDQRLVLKRAGIKAPPCSPCSTSCVTHLVSQQIGGGRTAELHDERKRRASAIDRSQTSQHGSSGEESILKRSRTLLHCRVQLLSHRARRPTSENFNSNDSTVSSVLVGQPFRSTSTTISGVAAGHDLLFLRPTLANSFSYDLLWPTAFPPLARPILMTTHFGQQLFPLWSRPTLSTAQFGHDVLWPQPTLAKRI